MTVKIMDVTVRDGSYSINYTYKPKVVGQIAKNLEIAGIDYIEVSHGCGLGAKRLGMPAMATDAEYAKSAKENTKGKIKVGVIAGITVNDEDINEVSDYIDFIRFVTNIGEPKTAKFGIEYIKNNYPDVQILIQMTRTSRRSPKIAGETAFELQRMGADTVYIVDTNGCMLPVDVKNYVDAVKQKCPDLKIGFHGHDNFRLATANSLEAIKSGVGIVDSSLRGIGRSAGNVETEIFSHLLSKLGLRNDINTNLLIKTSDELIKPIMPAQSGIESIDFITAINNIDIYPLEIYDLIASEAKIDIYDFIKALSKLDLVEIKEEHIKSVLKSLGKNADETMLNVAKTIRAEK